MRLSIRFSTRVLATLVAMLLCLSGGCRATMHERGESQIILQGAYGNPRGDDPLWWIGNGDAENYGVNVQYNYFVNSDFALSAIVTPYRVYKLNGDDTSSSELQVGLRWFFTEFMVGRQPLSLYLDVQVGRMHSQDPVPRNGTTTNWTQDMGFGLEYALSDSWSLVGGYHLRHVSDGSSRGVTENDNPSQNDDIWFFGVGYRW
ncbi:MAG: outer membrane beta-barrel protein [Planctomycetota bacterium]|nr:outer membrane beta-barrel protein [Planctomycetota bacterium]